MRPLKNGRCKHRLQRVVNAAEVEGTAGIPRRDVGGGLLIERAVDVEAHEGAVIDRDQVAPCPERDVAAAHHLVKYRAAAGKGEADAQAQEPLLTTSWLP